MIVPSEVFGASKWVVWSLHSPRLEAPNALDFAAVSPLLWFRHAPLGEHPLVIPPFLRGYRGGYCSRRIRSTKVLIEQKSLGKDTPTIFGAVFESTLNPETRRSGGMHYTSIENIHKVTHCS